MLMLIFNIFISLSLLNRASPLPQKIKQTLRTKGTISASESIRTVTQVRFTNGNNIFTGPCRSQKQNMYLNI